MAKLAVIFAGLAIFISCLGLFGLSMFMAERRSREVSIRRVPGATVTNLWLLLSKEFIWLVFIACLIASPLALWLMNGWLESRIVAKTDNQYNSGGHKGEERQ